MKTNTQIFYIPGPDFPDMEAALLKVAQICYDNSLPFVLTDKGSHRELSISYPTTGEKYYIGWKPNAEMIAVEKCRDIINEAKEKYTT